MEKIYDIIIIGGGPASMSAGVYAKQMKLDSLLIEKEKFGGQIATTSLVTNYLGFERITGEELSLKMHNHLESTGIEIANEEVVNTALKDDIKVVRTHNNSYKTRSVIIGMGTSVRNLGVDNEKKYIMKGISFSTLRDREKYSGQVVAVVGGGNSAIEDAIYLSEKCKKVYLVHRRNEFRADPQVVEDLERTIANRGNIELVLESKPHSIEGEEVISAINLTHIPSGEIKRLEVNCIFVAIGRGADTDIVDENILRNESGYIITNDKMETNIPGVYAVGDIRNTPLRQIVTAVSDGAIAVISARNYLQSQTKQ